METLKLSDPLVGVFKKKKKKTLDKSMLYLMIKRKKYEIKMN